MANPYHLNELKKGIQSWNIWREKNQSLSPDLSNIKLLNSDFTGANFSEVDLSGSILTNSILNSVDFTKADIRSTNFSKADLEDSDFTQAISGHKKFWIIIILIATWLLSGASVLGSSLVGNLVAQRFDPLSLTSKIAFSNSLIVIISLLISTIQKGIGYGIGVGLLCGASIVAIAVIMSCILAVFIGSINAFSYSIAIAIAIAISFGIAIAIGAAFTFSIAVSTTVYEGRSFLAAFGTIVFLGFYLSNYLSSSVIGILILTITIIFSSLGTYLGLQTKLSKELWLIKTIISVASIKATSFYDANLANANFTDLNMKCLDLRRANLFHIQWLRAKNMYLCRIDNPSLQQPVVVDLVTKKQGNNKDYKNNNLQGLNLDNISLISANLYKADLSHASLVNANLTNAILSEVNAIKTNFSKAILTGSCINAWNIDSSTNLQDVSCKYIYLENLNNNRVPIYGYFKTGEFTSLFQKVLNTVELIFRDGIDWKAFFLTFQELSSRYDDQAINIQSIEKKGKAFIIRLEIPQEYSREDIEKKVRELYSNKLKLIEQQYKAELQAKDKEIIIYKEQSSDMTEIAKLLATRQIKIEANAVTEREFNKTEIQANTIGVIHSGSGDISNFSQAIGNDLDAITQLVHALQESAKTMSVDFQDDLNEDLDDLVDAITDLDKRTDKRLRKRIMALWTIVCAIAVGVAGATDFSNNLIDLAQKLNVPLSIEIIQQNPHILQVPNHPKVQ